MTTPDAGLSYLYNATPSESLAPGSAEPRLVVADPAEDFAEPVSADHASAGASRGAPEG